MKSADFNNHLVTSFLAMSWVWVSDLLISAWRSSACWASTRTWVWIPHSRYKPMRAQNSRARTGGALGLANLRERSWLKNKAESENKHLTLSSIWSLCAYRRYTHKCMKAHAHTHNIFSGNTIKSQHTHKMLGSMVNLRALAIHAEDQGSQHPSITPVLGDLVPLLAPAGTTLMRCT